MKAIAHLFHSISGQPLAEFVGLGGELRIGERGNLRLQGVHRAHRAAVLLEQPVVPTTEYLGQGLGDHWQRRRKPGSRAD